MHKLPTFFLRHLQCFDSLRRRLVNAPVLAPRALLARF
jgi:hypothetical protein